MKSHITDRTALLVGSACNYGYGTIDAIDELSAFVTQLTMRITELTQVTADGDMAAAEATNIWETEKTKGSGCLLLTRLSGVPRRRREPSRGPLSGGLGDGSDGNLRTT